MVVELTQLDEAPTTGLEAGGMGLELTSGTEGLLAGYSGMLGLLLAGTAGLELAT
jgi:hypothetical protein